MSKLLLLVFLMWTTSMPCFAQFQLLGDADYMPGTCIQLTPDYPYSEGIAYSEATLNLNNDFEIIFDVYFGDKDDFGADGIAFVIHNDPRGFGAYGTYGECLGYGRWRPGLDAAYIAPSIAIEFDTYQNIVQNDPASDHVAYLENGSNRHTSYYNGNDQNYDLEDDRLHSFRFRWQPSLMKITVSLDNEIVFEGTRDLINDIFEGETEVIWGFTASTGRKYNLQYFCLRQIALYEPEQKSSGGK